LVGQRYRRKPPQRYRDHDIVALIQRAAALPSATHLRGRTYATLFGLLAVTGLRINEALHLDRSDVDLDAGVLPLRTRDPHHGMERAVHLRGGLTLDRVATADP
jgi:integrase